MAENDWRYELTQASLDRLRDDSALVDFIEANAAKALDATVQGLESIEKKTLTISTYLFAVISALTAYIGAHYDIAKGSHAQAFPIHSAMLITGYFMAILGILLWRCYIPKKISIPGNKPMRFINNSLLSSGLNYNKLTKC